uniref:C2H2-type domain-containing protein n=1 Tax=Bubo bubo TaxID=30461 RepID=A0A8C0EDJ9_BUBBB
CHMKGDPRGFICPLCMKVYVTPTDLSEHYQNEHTGTEGRQENIKNIEASLLEHV